MCDQTHCRWEWRTFSSLPEKSAHELGAYAELAPEQGKDIYLLGSQDQLNLKVRHGTLELKRRVKADANGLQLWCPIGTVRFPESAKSIAELLAPFKINLSVDDPTTRENFLEGIAHSGKFQVIEVNKSRRKFSYRDCLAELTQISINGQLGQTFCIESTSQEKLLDALRHLELAPADNVSWPRYLGRQVHNVETTTAEQPHGKVEVERKFLVDVTKWRPSSAGSSFRQAYLSSAIEPMVRVRTADEKGWLTIKGRSIGITRAEFEYEIPVDDAAWLISNLCQPSIIEKTRYREVIAGKVWEVDVFHGDNEGLVVAEIELCSPNESFEKPEWATLEVSDDPKYFNNSLAMRPFKDWER